VTTFAFENRIWEQVETIAPDQRRDLQLSRLRAVAKHVAKVPFYKQKYAEFGVGPDDIHSLDDIRRLPLTTKADLRDHYPWGFLAVPKEQIARIHGSSGTTGKPTFVAYTAEDRDVWANLCARFLVAGGLRPDHLVHICFGYGLFTGGFGLHYGVEKVGAAVVPVSSGNTPRQIMIMRDLECDVLVCTPSYALNIAEAASAAGMDPRDLPLKFAHFGGEPWTEDMRQAIEAQLGLLAFNNYGLSEIIGPGVSGECAARDGMHIQEDHFLVECLNPDTLEPVAEGELGELVITTLTKQAMPLLRYRTRDLAVIDSRPCACERTTIRMGRIKGRTDDMLIIRGVNVFPSQVEEALLRVEGTAPHYQIIVDRQGALDDVTVRVEISPQSFSDKMSAMQTLRDRIDREIQHVTSIRATVELVEPMTLERSQGKANRVVDKRREKGLI